MLLMVPTMRKMSIKSHVDLLPKKEDGLTPVFTLPEWLDPLIKVSCFLHFLRGEMRLPSEIMREIYSTLIESHVEDALDNIIVIKKIPKKEKEPYSSKWILEHIFEVLEKHQAIVLDPKQDVVIKDDEDDPENFLSIVLIIDGFSHLRELDHEPDEDDDASKMLKLLHSETDDEGDDKEDKPIEEEKEPEKEEGPTEWSCEICTFLNGLSEAQCGICGQG